ncbi:MAG: hypothetical protein JJT81_09490 [Rubellimicrobium sp.]|nr:hypothetical protein [Rubellimicrobium sp.]
MSTAFTLMMIWLALAGLNGFASRLWRAIGVLALLGMAPVLILLALVSQGWLPALFAAAIVATVYPAQLVALFSELRSGAALQALAELRTELAARLGRSAVAVVDRRGDTA